MFNKRLASSMKVSDDNWTESAYLQLITAVMKVEEEMLMRRVNPAKSGKRTPKWNQIAHLLPPGLRGKIPQIIPAAKGCSTTTREIYKCARMFDNLLRTYRLHMTKMRRRSNSRSRRKTMEPSPPMLTEAVCKLLQRREDLRVGMCPGAEGYLKTRRSSRIKISRHDRKKRVRKSTPSNSITVNKISSLGPSMGSATDKRAEEVVDPFLDIDSFSRPSGSSWHPIEVESSTDHGEVPHFDNNVNNAGTSRIHYDRFWSIKRHSAGSAPESGSGSEDESSELEPQKKARPSASPRAPRRDEARKRKTSDPEIHNSSKYYDRSLHAMITDSLLRDLDQEFSLLSSWIKSRVTLIGKTVGDEILSSREIRIRCIRSRKASKHLSDIDSAAASKLVNFDELMRESSKRWLDHEIQALFHELRTRFVEELKRSSVKFAQQLVEEALLPCAAKKRPCT